MLDIRIKRVYELAQAEDGCRVLVDRLWPRGLTKEKLGARKWLKAVAPGPETRKLCEHDPSKHSEGQWREFRRSYSAELDLKPQEVGELLALAQRGRLTLLFASRDPAFNQAAVLRDYLLEKGKAGQT
jgi:uncharacterized protein YeaO (DUF488 family)